MVWKEIALARRKLGSEWSSPCPAWLGEGAAVIGAAAVITSQELRGRDGFVPPGPLVLFDALQFAACARSTRLLIASQIEVLQCSKEKTPCNTESRQFAARPRSPETPIEQLAGSTNGKEPGQNPVSAPGAFASANGFSVNVTQSEARSRR